MNIINLQRVAHWLLKNRIPLLPKLIYGIQFLIYNSSIPPSVKIGKGTKCAYKGIGVVIHGRAIIGDNCTIGQGITIGGRSKKHEVPIIGNNVYIGAGARILGPIEIGDNCLIAPNAVAIDNVKSNTIVGGIPAKVLKEGIQVKDYV